MSSSDLLNRVRYSMILRGDNNKANTVTNDDEDDDISLAAFRDKRASYLSQLNDMQTKRLSCNLINNNHNINNYNNCNRNTMRNSFMRTSLSSGNLNILQRPITMYAGPSNGNKMPKNGMPTNGVPINGMPMNGIPMNGILMNGMSMNGMSMNGTSISGASAYTNKRQSFINSAYNMRNSRSSMSFNEFNKAMAEQDIQRKRQSIIESNKIRTQIMMNGYVSGNSSKNTSRNNSSSNLKIMNNSNERLNSQMNGITDMKRNSICSTNIRNSMYENEIQEYPGQKFITFTPMELNTIPVTASISTNPGQPKKDAYKSLVVENQVQRESYIPVETSESNYMKIENLKYTKQKKKEIKEFDEKIYSWINSSQQNNNNNNYKLQK